MSINWDNVKPPDTKGWFRHRAKEADHATSKRILGFWIVLCHSGPLGKEGPAPLPRDA